MKNIYFILLFLVIVSCQNQGKMDMQAKQASVDSIKEITADSMNFEFEKQKVIDSMQIEMANVNERKIETQKEVVVAHRQAAAATNARNTTARNTTASTANAPTAKKRKGWSSTAKGAVIGAGVGAATGAIISKKKGQGAIIGALAGAGIGAGTGAIIDGKKKE